MHGAAAQFHAMVGAIREQENASEESASGKRGKNCPAASPHAPAGASGRTGLIARKIVTEDLLAGRDCVQEKELAKELMSVKNPAILTLARF